MNQILIPGTVFFISSTTHLRTRRKPSELIGPSGQKPMHEIITLKHVYALQSSSPSIQNHYIRAAIQPAQRANVNNTTKLATTTPQTHLDSTEETTIHLEKQPKTTHNQIINNLKCQKRRRRRMNFVETTDRTGGVHPTLFLGVAKRRSTEGFGQRLRQQRTDEILVLSEDWSTLYYRCGSCPLEKFMQ